MKKNLIHMKTISLTPHQAEKLLIILDRGIYYYPGNTSKEDEDLVKLIQQLKTKKG